MDDQKKALNVEISPEQAEGIYANFVLIAHSHSEFIFDFARMVPGSTRVKVYSRLIMTPQNAHLLRDALNENLKKYEERFGKIEISGKESKEFGFKTNA